MGVNDANCCIEGWSGVEALSKGSGNVRWVNGQARARLKAPGHPWVVGVEVCVPRVPRGRRVTARLTARDLWVGKLPGYDPFVDVGFAVEPAKWHTIEFPLPRPPEPGGDVELLIGIDPPARLGSATSQPADRGIAVRRMWLRGNPAGRCAFDSEIVMGANDADHCIDGWSPVAGWRDGAGGVRWVEGRARARLKAPEQPFVVGMEAHALPGRRITARLTVRDLWMGKSPDCPPFIDVGFAIGPGRWETIEFPLPRLPPAGTELELLIGIDPAPESAEATSPRPGFAVRRMWLRGRLVDPEDVTVVVLNWNRSAETLACLKSLQAADLRGASVLVVDNGSRDGSVEAIRKEFPDITVVALPQNQGYAGGNNAGIRAALASGAKGIVLLNNDTEVAPDFLEPLLWTANESVAIGAVSSVALRMNNPELIDAAYLTFYFGHGIVWHHGVNALPAEGFDYPQEIEAGIGCCMLFKADALRAVGLFDESYFAYHEEVEWCFRARQAGWKIYFQPLSRVWHHGSKSTDAPRPRRRWKVRNEQQLPSPVPLEAFSPVRSYLGARNSVRFIRAHATRAQTRFFIRSSLRAVPLEFLAAVMGREEDYEIGAWTYGRALHFYFVTRHGIDFRAGSGFAGTVSRAVRTLIHVPVDLLWCLPRDVCWAYRDGHLGQVIEHIRGLWDGYRDKPLPLKRLGLQ